MVPDPDPAILVINLQDANKKQFKKKFFCLLLFESTFTSIFKDKKAKRSHKAVGITVFITIFCLVIEGSGSKPLANGSGSGFGSGSATLLNAHADHKQAGVCEGI
jgi:hypothetical protein